MLVSEGEINLREVHSFSHNEAFRSRVTLVDVTNTSTGDKSEHGSISHYSLKEPLGNGIFKYHRDPTLPPLDDDSNTEIDMYAWFYGTLATFEMASRSVGEASEKVGMAAGQMMIAVINTLW